MIIYKLPGIDRIPAELIQAGGNTYFLTPWCMILFEKLIVSQLVRKILLSYGTQRFITVFPQARHRSLS
jgi:hypothetical protein